MPSLTDHEFQIQDWTVNPRTQLLTGQNSETRLKPLPMALLVYMVQRPGQLIEKSALAEDVWGQEFISDQVISVAVHQIRKALNDDAKRPQFIKTIPRRGLMWIGDSPTEEASPQHTESPPRNWRTGLLLTLVVMLLFGYLAYTSRPNLTSEPSGSSADEENEAWREYSKWAYYVPNTPEGYREAVGQLDILTERFTHFAPIHVTLARLHLDMTLYGLVDRLEGYFLTRQHLEAAEAKGAEPSDVSLLKGNIALFYEWDFALARHHFREAREQEIQISPLWVGPIQFAAMQGDFAEAESLLEQARQLAPNAAGWDLHHFYLAFFRLDVDVAMERLERAKREMDERTQLWGEYPLWRERDDDSHLTRIERRLMELQGATKSELLSYDQASNKRDRLVVFTDCLLGNASNNYGQRDPVLDATYYAYAGNEDAMYTSLEKALATRQLRTLFIGLFPAFSSYRNQPRFQHILNEIGLPAGPS